MLGVHAFNPSPPEEREGNEVEVSMVCIACSRPTRAV